MDGPVAIGNLEGRSDKSDANLVDRQDVPLQKGGVQEEVRPGEHLEDGNWDEKSCFTRLPFEVQDQTFTQLPFAERSTTASLVCKRFTDVKRSYIYRYIHIHLGQRVKERETRQQNPRIGRIRPKFHDPLATKSSARSCRLFRLHNSPRRSPPPSPKPPKNPAQTSQIPENATPPTPPLSLRDPPPNQAGHLPPTRFPTTTYPSGTPFPTLPPLEITQTLLHQPHPQALIITTSPSSQTSAVTISPPPIKHRCSLISHLRFIILLSANRTQTTLSPPPVSLPQIFTPLNPPSRHLHPHTIPSSQHPPSPSLPPPITTVPKNPTLHLHHKIQHPAVKKSYFKKLKRTNLTLLTIPSRYLPRSSISIQQRYRSDTTATTKKRKRPPIRHFSNFLPSRSNCNN